jgi:polynucleotide 5'-kinase involved in rRNA processing
VSSAFLPLISPEQVQQPIQVGKDDSVFIVMRMSYPLLKKDVDSLNNKKYFGVFVSGPEDVGKSYLLYLLAAEYRLNRAKLQSHLRK